MKPVPSGCVTVKPRCTPALVSSSLHDSFGDRIDSDSAGENDLQAPERISRWCPRRGCPREASAARHQQYNCVTLAAIQWRVSRRRPFGRVLAGLPCQNRGWAMPVRLSRDWTSRGALIFGE